MTRVLIVEDEANLATGLKFNLEAEGYAVEIVDSGEAALETLRNNPDGFDLTLVDVMLPGIDGFEVVRQVREANIFVPVMMLTARGHTNDVLHGFEMGADDYLPKPFDLSILLARIQGLLRRREWHQRGQDGGPPDQPEEFRFGQNHLDLARQVLSRQGTAQPLTLMEANLLRYLVRNEGRTVSRKTLLEEVWGVRQDTDTRAVDNFIARLRRYIEEDPSKPQHLQTVRGIGYRFIARPDQVAGMK